MCPYSSVCVCVHYATARIPLHTPAYLGIPLCTSAHTSVYLCVPLPRAEVNRGIQRYVPLHASVYLCVHLSLQLFTMCLSPGFQE